MSVPVVQDHPSALVVETQNQYSKLCDRVSLVVPCYNESSRLDKDAFLTALKDQPDLHLIFVDDGSTDATLLHLQAMQAQAPDRISVAMMGTNKGKAEAVRAGLAIATSSDSGYVGYWDADLATPLEAVEDMRRVGKRLGDVDVILGSRRLMMGHQVDRTLPRRMVSRICNLMARAALGMPVGDT
jgi:dolichyl-phosphate beta-glucosyltransferase